MANEKRLIDANKAEKAVTDIYCGTAGYRARERLWQAVEAIKECPTVDAVEVVRCKDCKHKKMTPDNWLWCNAWCGINGMGDEGFCNYGERRTE